MLSVNRKTSTNQKKEKKRSEEAKIEPSYKSNFEVAGGGPGLLHHPSVCPSFGSGSGSPSTTAVDPQ